jgi:hypothetical protein
VKANTDEHWRKVLPKAQPAASVEPIRERIATLPNGELLHLEASDAGRTPRIPAYAHRGRASVRCPFCRSVERHAVPQSIVSYTRSRCGRSAGAEQRFYFMDFRSVR